MPVMHALSCAAVGLWVSVGASQSPDVSGRAITVHYTVMDQESRRYVYVPLEIPDGITSFTIRYDYDTKGGANAIDIGVIEPGPLTLGGAAIRGWSGGARSEVRIGVDDASPGYWPGPIPAGTWHVVFGLYKVAPEGVDVTIESSLSREPRKAFVPPRHEKDVIVRRGGAWYSGITHAHTIESDGARSTAELIDKARAERLDFLFITDHNNTTHQRFALERPDLLVITGEEVTTPAGHFNAWGIDGWPRPVDFRVAAGDPALDMLIASAHDRGALIGINHPVSDCLACTWTHGIPASVDAMEIANGQPAARQQAMAIWDTVLRSGRRMTAVEGRDWHRGDERLGTPSLRVWAEELSRPAILDGLRHGRAIVVADNTMPAPEVTMRGRGVTARIGDTLTIDSGDPIAIHIAVRGRRAGQRAEWVWNGEVVTTIPVPESGVMTFDRHMRASGYARVHLLAPDGSLLAVTNPIYVVVR